MCFFGPVSTHYIAKDKPNVLWEMHCSAETTEGLHSGADVSLLSQYPREKEMLFPPLTMLKVKQGTRGMRLPSLAYLRLTALMPCGLWIREQRIGQELLALRAQA